MPDQSLIVFGGNALATRVTPPWTWTLLLLALILTSLFLCSLIGAMVWWLCCLSRPQQTSRDETNHAEGFLIRLLKNPPNVAVSQERPRVGDIRDTKGQRMEREATGGQGLLPDAGLAPKLTIESPSEANTTTNAEFANFTKDLWGDFDEETQDADPEEHQNTGEEFPPTPTNSKASDSSQLAGPWWRDLLSSPAKRLRLSSWGRNLRDFTLPKFELPPTPSSVAGPDPRAGPPTGKQGHKRRKDLPKRNSTFGLSKPSRRNALKLAKAKGALANVIARVEDDYYASSSKAAKNSKRNTVAEILKAGDASYPLTPFSLKLIAGTLRESGYKSASAYLIEAKTEHVERGHCWTSLLDRHFKLCMTAARRGVGPRKKAAEVEEASWASHSLLEDAFPQGMKVGLSSHLFACGVHWMMREIELASLTTDDVKFDSVNRLVTLFWRESKKDSEGFGLARTLQCVCTAGCDLRCPYSVLETLANYATLKGAQKGCLALNKKGKQASKSELVKDWQRLYGPAVTGHSARRSGALQYIRRGWAVSQVGYLGRWKSNVIMEYAQEALESLAINNTNCFGSDPQFQLAQKLIQGDSNVATQQAVEKKADAELVHRLQEELNTFKADTKGSENLLEKAIREVESKMSTSGKYLPSLVRSTKQQIIHHNVKTLVYAPPHAWRTKCGWYYYASNYEFVEGDSTLVNCVKCQASAPRQGGGSLLTGM